MQAATPADDPRLLPRQIATLHRSRDAIFPRLFGDPAWDIVLYLYECHRDGAPATRARAGAASGSTPAVAARFLAALIHEGLVRPALGLEESHVELSDEGRALMEQWLAEAAAAIGRPTAI